jgi:ribosomal protein L40E
VVWEGAPFTMTLSATGCSGAYTWGATGLPAWLTLDTATGIISGIPGPGTCNTYNTVTVTCTDATCDATCCPPASRDFTLYVDCWANYLGTIVTYSTSGCDYTVEIGGLPQGQTNLLVDGAHEATLVGGQKYTFTSQPCQNCVVAVDQTVQPNSNTRFSVIGSNIKTLTDTDNYAYFNYAPEVNITTASDPSGATQPPGSGFYIVGNYFSSTTPGTIETDIQNGKKLVFHEWKLFDGTTRPTTNLGFIVPQGGGGTVTAAYDTYYLLTLKSEYPAIDERSWERQGSTATWNLSLHAVPLLGFWGFLGGVQSPLNASGSQLITGPTTVEIQWAANYTMPIVAIIIALLVIAGLIVLIYRLRSRPAAKTEVKEATPKAKKTAAENFCPKCGAQVEKDADFCKKCGKKLK